MMCKSNNCSHVYKTGCSAGGVFGSRPEKLSSLLSQPNPKIVKNVPVMGLLVPGSKGLRKEIVLCLASYAETSQKKRWSR